MLSYHDDESLKNKFDTSEHKVLEEAIGIPEWLARLQDTLFEGLPFEEGAQFSVDFLSSIPVGMNLEPVKWHFCAFVLKECIERMLGLPNISEDLREQVVNAIKGVLTLHETAILSGTWDHEEAEAAAREAAGAANTVERAAVWAEEAAAAAEWKSAEMAAWAAAWAASVAAAAEGAGGWEARAAKAKEADAAEAAAEAAAGATAWAAAGAAADDVANWEAAWEAKAVAETHAYKRYAAELIKILKETKE